MTWATSQSSTRQCARRLRRTGRALRRWNTRRSRRLHVFRCNSCRSEPRLTSSSARLVPWRMRRGTHRFALRWRAATRASSWGRRRSRSTAASSRSSSAGSWRRRSSRPASVKPLRRSRRMRRRAWRGIRSCSKPCSESRATNLRTQSSGSRSSRGSSTRALSFAKSLPCPYGRAWLGSVSWGAPRVRPLRTTASARSCRTTAFCRPRPRPGSAGSLCRQSSNPASSGCSLLHWCDHPQLLKPRMAR